MELQFRFRTASWKRFLSSDSDHRVFVTGGSNDDGRCRCCRDGDVCGVGFLQIQATDPGVSGCQKRKLPSGRCSRNSRPRELGLREPSVTVPTLLEMAIFQLMAYSASCICSLLRFGLVWEGQFHIFPPCPTRASVSCALDGSRHRRHMTKSNILLSDERKRVGIRLRLRCDELFRRTEEQASLAREMIKEVHEMCNRAEQMRKPPRVTWRG